MKPHWTQARRFEDIRYEKWQGIAKITINRPEVRNAFRPQTLFEMSAAFNDAREDADVGVVILTGEGKDAFCSGGDQRIRGDQGYVGKDGVPRLNVLDLQKQIRSLPKPVLKSRTSTAGFSGVIIVDSRSTGVEMSTNGNAGCMIDSSGWLLTAEFCTSSA